MRILVLTLMMSFLSHSAFASDSEDGGAEGKIISIGTSVIVSGLHSGAGKKLNGLHGKIISCNKEKERYGIKFDDAGIRGDKSIKFINVCAVEEAGGGGSLPHERGAGAKAGACEADTAEGKALSAYCPCLPIDRVSDRFDIYADTIGSISTIKLTKNVSEDEHPEEKNCIHVMQGEIALTDDTMESYILSTCGLGPCHGLILYNATNKKCMLAHIDGLCQLTILHNIFTYMDIDNVSKINIYIISGKGHSDTFMKIYDKLEVIGLSERIIGINLGKDITSCSIDTRTGEVSSLLSKGWNSLCPTLERQSKELKKTYGFHGFVNYERDSSWYIAPQNDTDILITPGELLLIGRLPKESEDNTFNNYNRRNETQDSLYQLSIKFANEVSGQNRISGPFYFAISGLPGIGKTHLGVSIAKYVKSHGKNVIYINSKTITELFTEHGEPRLQELYIDWLQNKDLIIIDDLVNMYALEADFFEVAFNYTQFNGKALLITSNLDINELFKRQYPLHFNEHCVKIASNIDLKSHRIPWIENVRTANVEMLAKYKGEQAAGVIMISDSKDRSKFTDIKEEFISYCEPGPELKIRLTDEPMDSISGTVKDLCVRGASNCNVVITQVFVSYHDAIQFLNLIDIAHNYKLKIIVLTDSIDIFESCVKQQLKYSTEKIRLYDRLRIIFPGINFR